MVSLVLVIGLVGGAFLGAKDRFIKSHKEAGYQVVSARQIDLSTIQVPTCVVGWDVRLVGKASDGVPLAVVASRVTVEGQLDGHLDFWGRTLQVEVDGWVREVELSCARVRGNARIGSKSGAWQSVTR